jgi:hypothetical protein
MVNRVRYGISWLIIALITLYLVVLDVLVLTGVSLPRAIWKRWTGRIRDMGVFLSLSKKALMAVSYIGRGDLPRGIRNNNPGNIKTGITWQGAIGDDGTFVIFQDVTWGIRALATDLGNKINKGENTITAIISVYAPPSENQTGAYIAAVSADSGIDANTPLTMDQATLHSLIRAIINHENGAAASVEYISDADIDQGIGLMNSGLLSLFQAAGVAVESAVQNITGSGPDLASQGGQSNNSPGLLILGGLAVGVFLLIKLVGKK